MSVERPFSHYNRRLGDRRNLIDILKQIVQDRRHDAYPNQVKKVIDAHEFEELEPHFQPTPKDIVKKQDRLDNLYRDWEKKIPVDDLVLSAIIVVQLPGLNLPIGT